MKLEQIECSETSVQTIQTPGNYPKEIIQDSEPGESLNSRVFIDYLFIYQYSVKVETMFVVFFIHNPWWRLAVASRNQWCLLLGISKLFTIIILFNCTIALIMYKIIILCKSELRENKIQHDAERD
jgi:hypothetical protein